TGRAERRSAHGLPVRPAAVARRTARCYDAPRQSARAAPTSPSILASASANSPASPRLRCDVRESSLMTSCRVWVRADLPDEYLRQVQGVPGCEVRREMDDSAVDPAWLEGV